jgi:hypothetical protein
MAQQELPSTVFTRTRAISLESQLVDPHATADALVNKHPCLAAAYGFHKGMSPNKRIDKITALVQAIHADLAYAMPPRVALNYHTLTENPYIMEALAKHPHMFCVTWDLDHSTPKHLCEAGVAQLCLYRCAHKRGLEYCDLVDAPDCCYMYYKVGRCPYTSPCGSEKIPLRGECPSRVHIRPWTGLVPTAQGPALQPLPTATDKVNFDEIFLLGAAPELDLTTGTITSNKRPPFTPEGDTTKLKTTVELMRTLNERLEYKNNVGPLCSQVLASRTKYALSRNKPAVRDKIVQDARDTLKMFTPLEQPRTKRPRDN